jgi:hypothetical protein
MAAISLLLAAAIGSSAGVASAYTLTVNTTADVGRGAGAGENPNACTGEEPNGNECPLRAALEFLSSLTSDSATEEIIALPPGHYVTTKGSLLVGQAHAACEGSVKCPVTLRGSGAGLTVIDSHAFTSVLGTVSGAGPVTIEGVTLTGGSTPSSGGAISAQNLASLTIRDSVLTKNIAAGTGGAINTAAPLIIEDSSITANRAGKAGGVEIRRAPLTLLRSTVSGNEAAEGGGGGLALIEEFGESVVATVTDSTVVGNSASEAGGGIVAFGTDKLMLRYSTIAGNTAASGGGVGSNTVASMTMEGAILAGDVPTECAGLSSLTTTVANIVSGPSSCPVSSGPAPLAVNPVLGPLSANGGSGATLALLRGSPAINAGGPSCPTTEALDQRKVARPRGAACDLGAFEVASDVGVTLAAAPDPVSVAGSLALTATVINTGSEALTGVRLTMPVPVGASFVSAPPGCSAAFSATTIVTCQLGSLLPGQSVPVPITVRPDRAGALSETAAVIADQPDYNPANDTATIASVAFLAPIQAGPGPATSGSPGTGGAGAAGSALVGRRFTFDAHGYVKVRVSCPTSAKGGCHDAIAIYSSGGLLPAVLARGGGKPTRATLLALAHATIKAGRTVSVRLRLNRAGRKLAKAHRRFRARLLLSAHDASAKVTSHGYAVTLKRAPTHHR